MEKLQIREKDLCLLAVDNKSVALVNPEQSLVVLYERRHKNDGYPFFCLLRKVGETTNTDDALKISIKSFCDGFSNSIKKHWMCFIFKDIKIITEAEKLYFEKILEDAKQNRLPLINSKNQNKEVLGIFV